MRKLNKLQVIGSVIILLGVITSFLFENSLIQTLSGSSIAIGIGYIFKWIPFIKQNLAE